MRRALLLVPLLVIPTCNGATAPSDVTDDPSQATFVTADIANFWAAYDGGGKDGDTSAFRRAYLDHASKGLTDFIKSRALSGKNLAAMVTAYPKFFAAIRESNVGYATDPNVVATVQANFARIKALYADAVFPPVTFLVGRFSSGGTTSGNGMLIGTEFYSLTPSTPVGELGSFQKSNVHARDTVAIIIAHEHTHILQDRRGGIHGNDGASLLERSLVEGCADFVGELVSGGNINAHIHEWALPHEADVWADFRTQMDGKDVSRWLYNQGSATPDRPGDLGYFIGYRIAKWYYDHTSDKRAALRDIIEIHSAKAFLQKSGYNGGS